MQRIHGEWVLDDDEDDQKAKKKKSSEEMNKLEIAKLERTHPRIRNTVNIQYSLYNMKIGQESFESSPSDEVAAGEAVRGKGRSDSEGPEAEEEGEGAQAEGSSSSGAQEDRNEEGPSLEGNV